MIRRSTWVMVVVFAILLGAAWIIQRSQKGSQMDATPTEEIKYLFDTQENSVTNLTLSDSAGAEVAFKKDSEGNWTLVKPEAEQADVSRIEQTASQANSLRILSSLETELSLDVVGLNPPAYRLVVDLEDGRRQTALIGNLTPTGSGYYVQVDGGSLQVINKFGLDAILELLTNPPVAPILTDTLGAEEPSPLEETQVLEATVSPQP